MSKSHDRDLGMDRPITRRDFLNGASIAVTGSLLAPGWIVAGSSAKSASGKAAESYPSILTGLRGSHPGSFEVAHQLRDGAPGGFGAVTDTDETYDLVVVGGGISGLAAAYFFRKEAGPKAKILVLDNHDDFGGHAKRNEFHHDGRLLVDLGGTEFIEAPSSYPPQAAALLRDLGIDVSRAEEIYDHDLYRSLNLRGAVFFDKETFGVDRLVTGDRTVPEFGRSYGYRNLPGELAGPTGDLAQVKAFIARTPLNERAKQEIVQLFCEPRDYLPDQSRAEKQKTLAKISYQGFLTDIVGVHPDVVAFFRHWQTAYQAIGIDTTPALNARYSGLPGLTGLGLEEGSRGHPHREDFHFPDGNASIARSLVRAMVPRVAPGNSMDDLVTARFDYGRLDEEDVPVRIRLNSTAVSVRHMGDAATSKRVEVTYVRAEKAQRVRAGSCVLACYNAIIPRLCPELPQPQKIALSYAIRVPLVSTNVLIRNWQSFHKLGLKSAYCPGMYHCEMRLTHPVSIGKYRCPRSPEEPMVVHLYRIPLSPGLPSYEQTRAGKRELLSTSFETFERQIRGQLGRVLSDGGFDPARDIEAVTVNRWPHGYASPHDPTARLHRWGARSWPAEKRHWVNGRHRFGRISIANSDAAASAMSESAIEQAYRAVGDLLR
jgi:spermidine dehydrogenase